jgi:hypothetical protein
MCLKTFLLIFKSENNIPKNDNLETLSQHIQNLQEMNKLNN